MTGKEGGKTKVQPQPRTPGAGLSFTETFRCRACTLNSLTHKKEYTSNLDVEGWAAVAGTDDDGLSGERSEGFEDGATELLQGGDVLCGDGVVYTVGICH